MLQWMINIRWQSKTVYVHVKAYLGEYHFPVKLRNDNDDHSRDPFRNEKYYDYKNGMLSFHVIKFRITLYFNKHYFLLYSSTHLKMSVLKINPGNQNTNQFYISK